MLPSQPMGKLATPESGSATLLATRAVPERTAHRRRKTQTWGRGRRKSPVDMHLHLVANLHWHHPPCHSKKKKPKQKDHVGRWASEVDPHQTALPVGGGYDPVHRPPFWGTRKDGDTSASFSSATVTARFSGSVTRSMHCSVPQPSTVSAGRGEGGEGDAERWRVRMMNDTPT